MQTDIDAIRKQMAAYLKLPVDGLLEASEIASVVPDSFLLVELLIELQEDYGVRLVQADLQDVRTVGDLAALIASRMTLQGAGQPTE